MTLGILLIGVPILLLTLFLTGAAARRAFATSGAVRLAHAVNGLAILTAFGLLALGLRPYVPFAALAMVLTGAAATSLDTGWARLLPLLGAALGVLLLVGLPSP